MVTTHEQIRFQDLTQQQSDFWDLHSEQQAREGIRVATDRYVFADTDPLDSLKMPTIPGHWLFGGRDANVPVSLSIERLRPFIVQGRPFEYELLPGSSHRLNEPEVMPVMLQWIRRIAARAL